MWRKAWRAVRQKVGAPEVATVGGSAALCYGLALVSQPLAWIVGGLLALSFAVASTRKPVAKPRRMRRVV